MALTKKQLDAGVRALLDAGNDYGDGCPTCGYGGFWTTGAIERGRPQYERIVLDVVKAVRQARTSVRDKDDGPGG